jgi:hypothetical protein
LKLATLPNPVNPAALIVEPFLAGDLPAWASPAMIEEYKEVLSDQPELLQRILSNLELCYPLTELDVIRHKPDNRFLECALAVPVDFIVTVNTARPFRSAGLSRHAHIDAGCICKFAWCAKACAETFWREMRNIFFIAPC